MLVLLAIAACHFVTDQEATARLADWDQDGHAGLAAGGTDCDDDDPDVHPGVPDPCGDGIDQDCDGDPSDCRRQGSVEVGEGGTLFTGGAPGDYLGATVALSRDLSGDGTPDLLVGAPFESTAAEDAGAVYLFSGPTFADPTPAGATAVIHGILGDWLGAGLATPGDLDRDGFDDLVVAAPFRGQGAFAGGSVAVVPGPLEGDQGLERGTSLIVGTEDWALLGYFLASLPPNDGLAGLALGCPACDGGEATDAGRAWVFPSVPAGFYAVDEATLVFEENEAGAGLGTSLASPGDVDGDGVNDLWLGASERSDSGAAAAGVVYQVPTDLAGVVHPGDVSTSRITATDGGDRFGTHLAVLDDQGDGYPDLLVSAPTRRADEAEEGAVYLFRGPLPARATADQGDLRWDGPRAGSQLGTQVASAGDFDGDGLPDILVAATPDDPNDPGTVWLLYGPLEDASLRDGFRVDGASPGDATGCALAGALDVTGDGVDDILLGAWGARGTGEDAGAAWLLPGQRP